MENACNKAIIKLIKGLAPWYAKNNKKNSGELNFRPG
jgi:hypothetical protein